MWDQGGGSPGDGGWPSSCQFRKTKRGRADHWRNLARRRVMGGRRWRHRVIGSTGLGIPGGRWAGWNERAI
jgi:hypothetical protein